MIAFTTLEKTKSTVKFDFNFYSEGESQFALKQPKILDNRKDDFSPTLTIFARDKETNTPVIGNIII